MSRLDEVRLIVYDCEVFAHDWLFVFKEGPFCEWFHNDPDGLSQFVKDAKDAVFVGFNNKHYDQWIMKAVICGCDPEQVKEVNDWIIQSGERPWDAPYIKGRRVWINNTDLMDDMQMGMSLKAIEGHLGMSIEESEVPFDHPDPLTAEQFEEVLKYCLHDVEATESLLGLRRDYLETKLHLAEMGGIGYERALSMTDPMLAAAFMHAERTDFDDERDYEFPDRLDYSMIPTEAVGFFKRIHDKSIPDEELFKSSTTIEVGGCLSKIAWGGMHGARERVTLQAGDGRMLLNFDVSSLYPSLMIEYGYVSRALPSPELFRNVREERFQAKANGDKATANTLKGPLNKSYGAMLNEYNPMHDAKMARSVCVSGQLSMLWLAKLYERIDGLSIVQINTDGILIDIPEDAYGAVLEANEKWQKATSLILEEDRIEYLAQRDVNNYALRKTDGSTKVKGGVLVRGISPIGAWSVNNNMTVVANAVKAFLLYGVPIEETVMPCDDPKAFQIIAKASHKYREVFQETDAGCKAVQMCNRVFATSDESKGTLFKVKAENGQVAKIASLPDHCLISNAGFPPIEEIDKTWYVALARKQAASFMPETERTEMATATKTTKADFTSMNVWRKLSLARRMFNDAGVKRSGKNYAQEYSYFELEDLVPAQDRIFEEIGLVEVFEYTPPKHIGFNIVSDGASESVWSEPLAKSTIVNVDAPEEFIEFKVKWGEVPPILSSKTGKEVTSPIQRIGGEVTYMRRYLKMVVLDAAECDPVDSGDIEKKAEKAVSQESKPKKDTAKAKPKTNAQRAKIAQDEAGAEDAATALQVRSLKKLIKTMVDTFGEAHPEVKETVERISSETDKLTSITKVQCEKAIQTLGDMKASFEKEG